MAVCRKFKSQNGNYSHRDPSFTETMYFALKYVQGVYQVARTPPKNTK